MIRRWHSTLCVLGVLVGAAGATSANTINFTWSATANAPGDSWTATGSFSYPGSPSSFFVTSSLTSFNVVITRTLAPNAPASWSYDLSKLSAIRAIFDASGNLTDCSISTNFISTGNPSLPGVWAFICSNPPSTTSANGVVWFAPDSSVASYQGTMVVAPVVLDKGACCNRWTGQCAVITQADCAATGLRFDGVNSVCSAASCSAITWSVPQSIVPTFAPPSTTPLGTGALALAVGDVNNDGRLDQIVQFSTASGPALACRVGAAGGAFGTPIPLPPGGGTYSPALLDVDGDGRLDVVAASGPSGSTVSVYRGNGDGTFQPPVAVSSGNGSRGLAAGDFNGDGRPDLVVANATDNTVQLMINNGVGGFTPSSPLPVGGTPADIVVGDFNGDGRLDLAVCVSDASQVSVRLGNGNGTFQPPAVRSLPAGSSPQRLAVGDVNGDGYLDIATANAGSSSASVLINARDGTFGPPTTYPMSGTPVDVALSDINGDGKLDLCTASQGVNSLSVRRGIGDGTFWDPISVPGLANSADLVIADVSGDGRPDLLVASADGVSVLVNTSPSTGVSLQPQDLSVRPGRQAVFMAEASGAGPFTYQWRKGGLPLLGATSGSFTIPSVRQSDIGAYDCVISGGNPSTSIQTRPAFLQVGTFGAACAADFDNNGAISLSDLFDYVSAWFAGCQ